MPLIPLLKLIFGLLALLVLGMAVWLLGSWWDDPIPADDGAGLVFVRDAWRLLTGLGLLAFSFLGVQSLRSFSRRAIQTLPSRATRKAAIGGVRQASMSSGAAPGLGVAVALL